MKRETSLIVPAGLTLVIVAAVCWFVHAWRKDEAGPVDGAGTHRVVDHVSAPGSGPGGPHSPAAASIDASSLAIEARTGHADPAETIRAFDRWTVRYLGSADLAHRQALVSDGIGLASARRAALRDLIARDPAAALRAAVPWAVRSALPRAVSALLEHRVSGVGDFVALGAYPAEGEDAQFRPVRREAVIDGRTYEAFVHGRRAALTTAEGIALHGVAVDGRLALFDSPVRVLEPGEPVPAGRPVETWADPEMPAEARQVASPARPRLFADLGDRVIIFPSESHAIHLAQALQQAEALPAAAGGDGATTAPLATAAPSASTGQKSLLFIRVRFADQAATFEPQDEAGARATVAAATSFLGENARGLLSLTATFTPVYTLPHTTAWYQANDTSGYARNVLEDARAIAANPGAEGANAGLPAFDHRAFDLEVVRYSGGPGGFAGQAYVGARGCWLKSSSAGVLAHELGHNLGLWHANTWNPRDPQSVVGPGSNHEYGDAFDTMGPASGGGYHFNTYEKHRLGWLPAASVADVGASGRWTLQAHDLPGGLVAGLSALRLYRDPDRDLWVEFRQNSVWAANRWIMNGAGLRWDPWSSSNGGSQLLDTSPFSRDGIADSALVVGRTFSDAVAGLHITPLRRTAGSPAALEVEVQVGTFPGNSRPGVSLSASSLTAAPGETVTFQADASDPDGDELSYAWDFADRSLAPSLPAAAKAWELPGDYPVRVDVSDRKGGTASAVALVRVGGGASGCCIRGTVLDTRGAPVAEVHVSNGLASSSAAYRDAWTDSAGNYALVGVPAGTWTLAATRPGWTLVRAGGPAELPVPGSGEMRVDFNGCHTGYRVQGSLRSAEGAPVPGAIVRLGDREEPTDATGAFIFTAVTEGTYSIAAEKDGMRFEPRQVEVAFADVTDLILTEPTYTLSGEVHGLPAGIRATITDGHRATTTYTDGTGPAAISRFVLPGVPAGSWHLRVILPEESFSPSSFLNPLPVAGDQGGLIFARDSTRSFAITGRVVDGTGGLAGARVSAGGQATTTDSRGAFYLPGLASGTHLLRVSSAGLGFTPEGRNVDVSNGDVAEQNFVSTRVEIAPVFVQPAMAVSGLSGPFVNLLARADDDGGARHLRYRWEVQDSPPAPVTFAANDSAAAAATTARFSASGRYRLSVTATDAAGASARSDLVFDIAQTPSRLVLLGVPASITAGLSHQFSVQCFDQYGAAMPVPPAVSWQVNGGGSIDETGFFSAVGEGSGFVVSAAAGAVATEARFDVVRPLHGPVLLAAAQATPAEVGASLGTTLTVGAWSEAGEASLSYQWSVVGAAPGPVAFLPNGGNSAKQTFARFSRSGVYSLRVVVRDASGQAAESQVEVRVRETVASWRNRHFSAAQLDDAALERSVWGSDADPDGDGVVNLLEYAFEMNPLVPGVEGLPKQRFVTVDGARHLAIVFRRNPSATDIVYTPQASTDLAHWESGLVVLGDPQANPVTYRDARPVAGQPKRFMRVEVTVP